MAKIFEAVLQLWPQWCATLLVCLLNISIGLASGWTSPYLAQLTGENPPFRVTFEEGSWIASLLHLGRLLGAVIGSLLLEYIGSKMSVLLTGVPMIFSWICIICANSPIWLYVARIFSGMSMGMVFSCYPIYIGEISAPSIRGALVCVIINGLLIGILFASIMGPNMSMMYFGIISLIVTLCYIAIFPFLPQTPYYYVRHNDIKRAEQAIQWYYRKPDVKSEIEAVEHFVKSTSAKSIKERLEQIKKPENRHSLIMIILLYMFMQLSGLNTILFYMEIIARKAMVTLITPSTLVIIISAINIIVGWMGVVAIDRCGRRILLAISSFGVITGMILLGLYFFLMDYDYDPSNLEWLIILSFLMLTTMMFGLTLVPSAMLSELFPSDLKSIAGFVGSISSAIFAFVASKTYQSLVDIITEKYVFWIYAVIMLISLIYSLIVVPETKGKTLQEIQDMMIAGRSQQSRITQQSRVETG
ncbi:facilitated trehalose transporter Tret1 [Solenopsis invicta]|uniref:facilitated trehalose transporter Tret1 n=1 Tax=Solenopsis invicta TaxID=13686 RepID=UPI000E33DBF1|nr:facilitated trehalose transporter Tret1 [Solenopsis invicta]XP_039307912.1 facilitated trehalose transporter Tret1 [Solenopsis invicta]